MIVGKLTPPDGIYGALRAVRNGNPMNIAVLLILSQNTRGKIGIANNRVIIGASVEGSGETGQAAFEKMAAQFSGMYGVREPVQNEKVELQQKLLVDIDQMLQSKAIDVNAIVPSRAELDINEVDPSYLDWLQGERNKVFSDIEASMNRARASHVGIPSVGAQPNVTPHMPPPAPPQQAAPPSRPPSPPPAQQAPQADQSSSGGKRWQGLDDIPTPAVVQNERRSGQPDTRPAGSPERRATGDLPLPNAAAPSGKISGVNHLRASEDLVRDEMEGMEIRKKMRIGIAVAGVLGLCAFINFMLNHNAVNTVFGDANRHFAKGEYNLAIFLLSEALAKDPNNGRLHLQKGLAHARLQQYDDALKEYDLAIAKGASKLPALLARASAFNETKTYDKAIAECTAIIAMHPDCVPAYLLQATAFDHTSQPELAEAACSKGLKYAKTADEKAHLLLERGYALARMHKNEEAEKELSQAIELEPTLPMYMARGDVYKKLGKYPEAIADYSAVIERDPNSYNALVARGMAENRAHEEENALKDFAAALKINKHGVEAYIQRGSLYLSRHAYTLAVNDFEDARKLNPRIAETQQKLDAAYKQLRGSVPKTVTAKLTDDTANASATAGKFKLPTSTPELLKVGYKYLNDGELEFAIACFRQAVKLNPNNEEGRKYLAHALFEAGDSSGAAAQFEVLNKLSGVDDADILPFSQSLARAGQTSRAIQVLESYLQQNPGATNYRCDLANLYMQAKQPARANATIAAGLRLPLPNAHKEKLKALAASFNSSAVNCDGTPAPNAGQ